MSDWNMTTGPSFREQVAARVLELLIVQDSKMSPGVNNKVAYAVRYADALITELAKERP